MFEFQINAVRNFFKPPGNPVPSMNSFWRQREGSRDSIKEASSVVRSKDSRPVANIESQLMS